jgi:hypothetical protein
MRIVSLSFGRTPASPIVYGHGIAIALDPAPSRVPRSQRITVHGSCRLPKLAPSLTRLDLLLSVFLTTVNALQQMPLTANLVGEKIVCDDDVDDLGDDWVSCFRCDLVTADDLAPPYYLHGSIREHVSNILRVEP